jgi:hypothetical protein
VPERVFSHIPGYPQSSLFGSRVEFSESGIHRPTMAGITGSESEDANSIVLIPPERTTRSSIQGMAKGMRRVADRCRPSS